MCYESICPGMPVKKLTQESVHQRVGKTAKNTLCGQSLTDEAERASGEGQMKGVAQASG